jgi:aspartate carbamoyltransferase catalytic subunit
MPSGVDSWPAETSSSLDDVLGEADAVMMLRVQRERMSGGYFPTPREYTVGYGLTRARLCLLKPGAAICHPGPMNRGLEISADAADAANSLILNQVAAGVAVRMSVLYELLGGEDEAPAPRSGSASGPAQAVGAEPGPRPAGTLSAGTPAEGAAR